MITLGVDLGSRTTKAVLLEDGKLLARRIISTGWAPAVAAEEARAAVVTDAGLSIFDVDAVVATGYGRVTVPFPARLVTEITCHAAGAASVLPEARTVIDVGGQDSKVIRIDQFGLVSDFAMNDRCAAGTGRFLEFMAQSLEVEIGDFAILGAKGEHPADLSSICTVFAESEVLSLVAEGSLVADIVAGIHRAIARRIVSLAETVGLVSPVAMTGGGALNAGLRHHLAALLKTRILLPPNPQTMGAEGAAIIAGRER
jgi:predicted CoA-substrate-specific enzyme activase